MTMVRTDGSDDDGLADNLSLTLSAAGVTGIPAINAVVSASAFGGFTTIAPGTWVEIYGTNLSSTTNTWSGSDFKNGVGPTLLKRFWVFNPDETGEVEKRFTALLGPAAKSRFKYIPETFDQAIPVIQKAFGL